MEKHEEAWLAQRRLEILENVIAKQPERTRPTIERILVMQNVVMPTEPVAPSVSCAMPIHKTGYVDELRCGVMQCVVRLYGETLGISSFETTTTDNIVRFSTTINHRDSFTYLSSATSALHAFILGR